MPTYDYKCTKCGDTFEIFQSMKDEPIKKCIKCDGEVKRLIGTGAGTIFKGSGFYQTDYKNPPKKSEPVKTEATEKPAAPKKESTDKV